MRSRTSHRYAANAPRRGRFFRPLAALTATTLALGSVVALGTSAAAVGSDFEIDRNQVNNGGFDWEDLAVGDDGFEVVRDPIGNDDTSTFGEGTSENDYPAWSEGSDGSASGKSDIGNVLVYSDIEDATLDQWLFLAFDRGSGTGTGRYYIELNQLEQSGIVPTRTGGDLRISIGDRGNQGLACQTVDVWSGGAWATGPDCSAFEVSANLFPIADFFDSPNANDNGNIPPNRFVEMKLNLTDLGIGGLCPSNGFAGLQMRSQEGNFSGDTSALKDYAVGTIDVPSLCSDLTILKESEDGVPLPGATFEISPNPTGEGPDPLEFTTGEDGTYTFATIGEDFWGTEFTVTETAAPDGYLLPADRDQTITIDAGESASLTFVDPMPWEPLTIDVEGSAEQFITRTWTNDKQTSGEDSILLPADQTSVELEYVIEVTESDEEVTAEDRSITVVVDNPNPDGVVGTLEVAIDGEACTVEGATDVSAAPGLQVDFGPDITGFDVTCPNPPLDGTVQATVTWDLGDYPQTQDHVDDPENAGDDTASDSVEITAAVTDEGVQSVDVYDDFTNPDLEPEYLGTVTATGSESTTQFDVTQVIEVGPGECLEVTNDGYIVATGDGADGDRIDTATEVVEVCREAPADLTIYKEDEDGQPLPGATFTISPNPVDPAGDDPLEFTVDENGVYTFSDVVHFGDYTVTETIAPDGYLLPADRDQTVTLVTGADEALTFVDPLIWEPLTVNVAASQFVTRTWANDKAADATTIDLRADEESATINYTIEVVEGDTVLDDSEDPSRTVTVTVDNPNAGTVTGTLDVDLDGTVCTLEGTDADDLSYDFVSGANILQLDCPNPPLFGTVTATVTWDLGDYPQTQDHVDDPENAGDDTATDTLDLAEVTTDNGVQSVDVWDDFTNPDTAPVLVDTVAATGSETTTLVEFSETFEVAQGECLEVDNTAFLVATDAGPDGDRLDESSASVTICRDAPAELDIVKVGEDETPIPGVTFEVSPNPLGGADALVVVTGEDGTYTIDQIADFGEYDVTEISVPAESGYLLPPPGDRTQTVELVEGETTEVEFVDPLAWEPLTVDVSADQFVTRTWTDDKQTSGEDSILVPADQTSVELEYVIEVVEGDTVLDDSEDPSRTVTVTVDNPNAGTVTGTLDVGLDGTVCTLEGTDADDLSYDFVSGANILQLDCPNPPLFGTVTATVTWDLGDYPQTQDHVDDPENAGDDTATDTLDLAEVTTDNGVQSVDVYDDFTNPDLEPEYLGTVTATGSESTTQFDVTQVIEVGPGECLEVTNDGYIVATDAGPDGDRIDTATEVVEVCREAPADLTIYKEDEDGQPLPGATFTISPNPVDPAGDDPLEFTVDENGVYTFSDVVHFGEYTVTETIAPEGYLLPADRDQTVTLVTGADEALTFVDPLIWEPLDIEVQGEGQQFVSRTFAVDKEPGTDPVTLPADQAETRVEFTVQVVEGPTTLDDATLEAGATVTNPNAGDVLGTVAADFEEVACTVTDGDGAVVDGPYLFGGSEATSFTLTCENVNDFEGTLAASVTWDLGDHPQTQEHVDDPEGAGDAVASDAIEIDPGVVDEGPASVEVWDDWGNPDYAPVLLGTVEAQEPGAVTEFPVGTTVSVEQGRCVLVTNEAYVLDGARELDRDGASVQVCRDVPVTPPQPPLPQTGTNTALAAIGALLLIGTGAGMMFVRRRTRG